MLNNTGFDLLADGYDEIVKLNEYPFVGYKDVLDTIYYIFRRK